jgi:hypothetical protein
MGKRRPLFMPDPVTFLQDRIGRLYQEQVWAVALVLGTSSFVVGYAKTLAAVVGRQKLEWCVRLVGFFALLFVWSRHAIYLHYDGLLKKSISTDPGFSLFKLTPFQETARFVVGWSGVILYTLIILAMTWASTASIRKE